MAGGAPGRGRGRNDRGRGRGGVQRDRRGGRDARFLERVRPAAVAIAGVFASIAPEQELAATDVARRTLGRDIPVAVSHEIGTLGLLERENATVLNAALTGAFDELAKTVGRAFPSAEAYAARGDGTLMALAHALRLPSPRSPADARARCRARSG